MMKKVMTAVAAVLFVLGLGVLLYPHIYQYFFDKSASRAIAEFIESLPAAEADAGAAGDAAGAEEERLYPGLYEAFEEYNASLAAGGQSLLSTESAETFPVNMADYGVRGDAVGYLTLPAVALELPLYLGASSENLQGGVAVMGYTSAPIGGESTNCVIAGHNNWNGAGRFRCIEDLQPGDEVSVTTFWGERVYTVTGTALIEETDVASICISQGKDMVTLLTCHYSSGAKMRYVVFCEFLEER